VEEATPGTTRPRDPEGLVLHVLTGPVERPFAVAPGATAVIGRARESDVCVPSPEVSRKHAVVLGRGGGWCVIDQGGRTGTFLNGSRIDPGSPAALSSGDLLRVGPCALRVAIGPAPETFALTIDGSTHRAERQVRRSAPVDRRLRALTGCVAAFAAARDETRLADAALRLVLEETGYARGALLRRIDGNHKVQVVADRRRDDADREPFVFSRSLVEQAAGGTTAMLSVERPAKYGVSIAELRIHSALCAPIVLGGGTDGFLYLDARGRESSVQAEADGFCDAVAQAYAMALAGLKRAELERRQADLHAELEAAREAQQFILPPPAASVGCIRYAMRMQAGLFVAGDLFDVVPLRNGSAAVAIGDVAGHGVSSGLLMAAAQAHLNALLRSGNEPGEILTGLNHYLAPRSGHGRFATLWLGIFSPDGTLRYADAGHGHWAAWSPAERRCTPGMGGGIPLGINEDARYDTATTRLGKGDRVILYSDGLAEGRNPRDPAEIGRERILAAIGNAAPEDDVAAMFRIVAHADKGPPGLSLPDDATAACVELTDGPC
jgi:serine phosphatase RsbU (regulator of sigma subunit)